MVPRDFDSPASLAGGSLGASAVNHRNRRKVRVKALIRIPRAPRGKRARFISPATQGMTLTLTGPTQLNETIALRPALNPACTKPNGVVLCVLDFDLYPGNYNASATTYDEPPLYDVIPPSAHVLSTAKNIPLSVRAGTSNALDLTLGGVPASLALTGLPSGTIGTALASPQLLSIVAKDADGYTIVGPYANPVTLADSDSSGATTITTSGSDNPPAHKLLSSSDTATFGYTGGPVVSATVSASAVGATGSSGTFVPVFRLSSSSGSVGTIVSETISGAGFVSGNTAISGTGVTVRNVAVNSATSLTADLIFPKAATNGVTLTVTTGADSNPTQSFTATTTGEDVVTRDDDTAASDVSGVVGNGAGQAGDLRYELLNAHAGDTIVFDTIAMCAAATCTVTLAGPLPPIQQNQTIDGTYFGRITIDGSSAYRAFWVDTGSVTIANLQIQNAHATGGDGAFGIDSGGGGAGLGGALFVNKASAAVALVNDYFTNDEANGGNGGGAASFTYNSGSQGGGGGGGLGGGGGAGDQNTGGGGGAGGILATGSGASGANGAAGGYGGGGGGGAASGSSNLGGVGGLAFGSNTAGSPGVGKATPPPFDNGGLGGNGGFGGGGGGGGGAANGGAGGFGGGGGGGGGDATGFFALRGGNGGPGGGGGGGDEGAAQDASGGALATISGGKGDNLSDGGGGAAAGPVAFVYLGTLTITNSGASSNNVTAGVAAYTASGATAGGSDTNPIYNNGGTVNGSTTTGGITMPSTTPASRRRASIPLRHPRRRQP